ncbi:MAG: PqqD family protein [Paludibacter sp.]|nr:PqqD family protein [Paludibacter sp.]
MKSKFVAREVGNEMILVPLSGNVAQMNELFTLNETARFIWENATETNTIRDIENLMTEQFDIDPVTAKKDIEQFMSKLESTFHS